MKKIVQKIILSGVIVHDGKVLIVHRSEDDDSYPGFWEIPGGKREPLEKSVDGVKREVKEETGLDVEVGDPFSVFEFKVEKEDEIRDATQIGFLAKVIGNSEVKLSDEHQGFVWITKDEIDNYNLSDETKETIRKAFSVLK